MVTFKPSKIICPLVRLVYMYTWMSDHAEWGGTLLQVVVGLSLLQRVIADAKGQKTLRGLICLMTSHNSAPAPQRSSLSHYRFVYCLNLFFLIPSDCKEQCWPGSEEVPYSRRYLAHPLSELLKQMLRAEMAKGGLICLMTCVNRSRNWVPV